MFGFIISALNLTLSTLLPTFLTYKALSVPAYQQTPSTLHPWLTYWITNSLVLSFPRFLPFDSYLRLAAHIYLLVPGRAEAIYQTHIRPWLQEHEAQIEATVERVHDQGRNKAWELLRMARELLLGKVLGDEDAVRRKELEEEEKRRERERQATGVGFVHGLLQRWSSESREQEVKAETQHSRSAPVKRGLVGALGGMVSAAAGVGIDKIQSAVASSDKVAAADAEEPISASSHLTAPQVSAHIEQSTSVLTKSRSEVDFEKIEQEEAPRSEAIDQQKGGTGWTSWFWNSKPTSKVVAPGGEKVAAKSSSVDHKTS